MFTYYPPRYLLRRYEILRHVCPAESFLEVGAGGLQLSCELLNYFTNGKAIDFSPEAEAIYRSLKPATTKHLSFERTDIAQLTEKNCYDCVVACEVMEHLEDDRSFLTQLSGLLKPQGQLILSVPAHMKFWSVHDDITGHYRRYERAELTELLRETGFEHIMIIAYGYPFINLLRWLRILYATRQSNEKARWSKERQTQYSGINHISDTFHWLSLLINPSTALPANWITRLFNATDLSEGYIAIARKGTSFCNAA